MTDPTKERLTLTITEAKEPQSVGDKGAKKLSYKAKGEDGKEFWYYTMRPTLFGQIKVDAKIEGDYEISENEYGAQRKLVEVYKDGAPVGGSKGGWQPRGQDPETRRSIERQTSLHIAAQMSEPGISVTDLLDKAEQIFEWTATGKRLDKTPGQAETEQAPTETTQPIDNGLDIGWFRETVKDPAKYKLALGYLKEQKAKGKSLSEMAASLTKEQVAELVNALEASQ